MAFALRSRRVLSTVGAAGAVAATAAAAAAASDGGYAYARPAPQPPPSALPATTSAPRRRRSVFAPLETPSEELARVLRAALGAEAVETDAAELALLGRDLYSHHAGGPAPQLAAFPRSAEEVQLVVRECARLGVPLVPRGAGTSLEGHVTTPLGGCVLDVSRMDRVLAVRPGDLDATVQAGVRWQALNELLLPHGLFFPVDPGPGACVGGMVGTGCSGTNAMRHGAMRANVVALECVLADGSLVKTASRARKSSAGYDLTGIVTGSEGTLAVVTAATLRLAPLPAATAVAVSSFASVRDAAACAAALLRAGVPVAALELLDAPMVGVVNAQSGFAYPPQPLLLFKLAGASEERVADDARRVAELAAAHGGSAFDFAADAAGRARLWEARKVALWSASAQHPGKRIATTDVCVPLSRLPDLMAEVERETERSALPVYAVAHAGDGNAHHFIVYDAAREEEVAEAKRLNTFLVRRAIAMEGTCTGEHGVGVGKLGYLAEELGEGNLRMMRTIKRALDPAGLLNAGKKVPAEADAADAAKGERELPLFVGAPACMH